MQCDEVQAYLAEHSAGRLADRLSGTVQTYIRQHMVSCPDCCEEMEHFEEMQAALRSISLEPCDSSAMRARFNAFMTPAAPKPSSQTPPRIRRNEFLFVVVLLALTAFAALEAGKWLAGKKTPVVVHAPVPPIPVSAPAQAADSVPPPWVPTFLSGIIQYPDDRPAAGIPVLAIPVDSASALAADALNFRFQAADFSSVHSIVQAHLRQLQTRTGGTGVMHGNVDGTLTDGSGGYRLRISEPGNYYIAAGFADASSYYPGAPDLKEAKAIAVSSGKNLDTLGIRLPASPTNIVSGRMVGVPGALMTGASVEMRSVNAAASLLPPRPYWQTLVDASGAFEIRGMPAGPYQIEARIRGTEPLRRNVFLNGKPVNDLQFVFSPLNVSGRVLLENGGEVPEPLTLGELGIRDADTPTALSTTVKLDGSGRFSLSLKPGSYRIRFGVLSQEFTVRSMTAGSTDLMKEPLRVLEDVQASVDIRVARRNDNGVVVVRGTVLDGLTNAPPPADRVALCCFSTGPVERISTVLHTDGSFAFNAVPPGRYTVELRGKTSLVIANPAVDVPNTGTALKMFSASKLVPIAVSVVLDSRERLPYKPDMAIVFTGKSGNFRGTASPVLGNTFQALLAADDAYAVAVSNIASGYAVLAIRDGAGTDLLHGGHITAAGSSMRVEITLTKK